MRRAHLDELHAAAPLGHPHLDHLPDQALQPCASHFLPRQGRGGEGVLARPLPAVDDPEGARVRADLPPVVDAHVHLFPDRVFDALWRWFDAYGWPIRYRLYSRQVIEFLTSRGVRHLVGLHYAHQPGMARALNRYVAELAAEHPQLTALATVLPGEPDAVEVLREAFDLGLRGVKLHCHVQCFAPDHPDLAPLYALCAERGLPMVIHAGREPKSPAYRCDPYLLCSADRVARVLEEHPRLKLCVPHLGADEYDAYADLLERHDNLWLDTTMMLADYMPVPPPRRLLQVRPDRILYGTDFPNLPYAWDRELVRIARGGYADGMLEALLGGNAASLFGIGDGGASSRED